MKLRTFFIKIIIFGVFLIKFTMRFSASDIGVDINETLAVRYPATNTAGYGTQRVNDGTVNKIEQ